MAEKLETRFHGGFKGAVSYPVSWRFQGLGLRTWFHGRFHGRFHRRFQGLVSRGAVSYPVPGVPVSCPVSCPVSYRLVSCSKMNAARFHGGFKAVSWAVSWFGGNLRPRGGLRVRFHTRFHGRFQGPVSWPVSWASGFMAGFMGRFQQSSFRVRFHGRFHGV